MRRAAFLLFLSACGGGELDGPTSPPAASPGVAGMSAPGAACSLAHATSHRGAGAGSCALIACDDGFADCDGVSANGCEASLLNDPASCGACDHACSTCERGACGALSTAADDTTARELVADGARLAWIDAGRLRVSDGDAVRTWTTALSVSDRANEAGAIALAPGVAVVADVASQRLIRVAESGGVDVLASGAFASVTVRSGVAFALRVATSSGAGSVVRVPLDGGPPSELATGLLVRHACRIAVDAAHVYWTDPDAEIVWRVPVDGGTPEPWAKRQRMTCGVLVDDVRAHWVSVDPTLAMFVLSVPKTETPDPDWIQTAVEVGKYAPEQHAWDLSLGDGFVWLANGHDETVWRVDPATDTGSLVAGAQQLRGIAAGQGVAWGTKAGVVRLVP